MILVFHILGRTGYKHNDIDARFVWILRFDVASLPRPNIFVHLLF